MHAGKRGQFEGVADWLSMLPLCVYLPVRYDGALLQQQGEYSLPTNQRSL